MAYQESSACWDLNEKVLEIAFEARSWHELSCDLMNSIILAGGRVTEILLPDAMKHLNVAEVISLDATIEEIIGTARELGQEAAKTQARYADMANSIQDDMAWIDDHIRSCYIKRGTQQCNDALGKTEKHLGIVYNLLLKLAMGWGSTATLLEYLERVSFSSTKLIKHSTKENVTALLRMKLDDALKKWQICGDMWRLYFMICNGEPNFCIKSVYAFLDGQPASMDSMKHYEVAKKFSQIG